MWITRYDIREHQGSQGGADSVIDLSLRLDEEEQEILKGCDREPVLEVCVDGQAVEQPPTPLREIFKNFEKSCGMCCIDLGTLPKDKPHAVEVSVRCDKKKQALETIKLS